MNIRRFFASYALVRRATFATVATLLAMLLLAGLTLAALFAREQIEQGRIAALTQANVASSTVAAALRFSGKEIIADALRVFDSGPDPDSAAVYDRQGRLLAEVVAPGEATFPPLLSAINGASATATVLASRPVQLALRDGRMGSADAILGPLVVSPNQHSLSAAFARALTVLAIVLAITLTAGIWTRLLSQAMLRPVADLTAHPVAQSHGTGTTRRRFGGGSIDDKFRVVNRATCRAKSRTQAQTVRT